MYRDGLSARLRSVSHTQPTPRRFAEPARPPAVAALSPRPPTQPVGPPSPAPTAPRAVAALQGAVQQVPIVRRTSHTAGSRVANPHTAGSRLTPGAPGASSSHPANGSGPAVPRTSSECVAARQMPLALQDRRLSTPSPRHMPVVRISTVQPSAPRNAPFILKTVRVHPNARAPLAVPEVTVTPPAPASPLLPSPPPP
eukprot:EG_transcript_30463